MTFEIFPCIFSNFLCIIKLVSARWIFITFDCLWCYFIPYSPYTNKRAGLKIRMTFLKFWATLETHLPSLPPSYRATHPTSDTPIISSTSPSKVTCSLSIYLYPQSELATSLPIESTCTEASILPHQGGPEFQKCHPDFQPCLENKRII